MWESIRPLPDQKANFEELCSQVLRAEAHADDAYFQRQGFNDKGCEALWRSASAGDVAVQAKFFTRSLAASEFGQIDASVKTALANFPDLVRYIICVPTLLSDSGGVKNGKKLKSARDRWNEHKAKWLGWGQGRQKSLEFVLWDKHELQIRVQRDAGLAHYFFDNPPITAHWASEQFQSTLDRVGQRYTPKLNVRLSLSSASDALLRSDRFTDAVFRVYREAEKALGHVTPVAFPDGDARERVTTSSTQALQAIRQLLPLDDDRHSGIDFIGIAAVCVRSASALQESFAELPIVSRYDDGHGVYTDAGYRIRAAAHALRQLSYLMRSSGMQLATNPIMMLVGEAGTGKTHFLCDVVERALRDGHVALMMLSEQFRDSDPLVQMIGYFGLTCTADEFLGALNSAAIFSGVGRSLLVIDALNEEPSNVFWQRSLAKLMRQVQKYPHVGLIVSLRTDHESAVLDDVIRGLGVRVQHDGFSYELFEAQRIYFAEYNIQPPGPLLSREYENPLYLKTLCETLAAEGLHRIPAGHRSIIELFSRYIAVVGKSIATKLGEDPNSDSASHAISALANAFAVSGMRLMPYEAAKLIVQEHQQFKPSSYHGSLFRHLLSENVLASTTNSAGRRVVRFMFEKIADHAIAKRLIDNAIAAKGHDAALEDEQLLTALNPPLTAGFRTNTLHALALQIPERLGIEIADSPAGEMARALALTTLPSRAPESITLRTAEIVIEALSRAVPAEDMWDDGGVGGLVDDLVALATIPGHPLDAAFLHRYLLAMTLPRRDAFWTIRVNHADPDHTLNRVLSWSRTAPLTSLDVTTRVGLATVLCWMTASSNRARRDHATKVLAQLMIGAPSVAERLLADFRDCNDPYVMERLLCAIYGSALMTADADARRDFAQAVYVATLHRHRSRFTSYRASTRALPCSWPWTMEF